MRRFLYLLLAAAAAAVSVPPSGAQTAPPRRPAPVTRPVARAERVLVISVDGLRPDLLLRCNTPVMHALFEGGSYTFWAKTVPQSITLPSHTSMLTGVSPRKHGIEWNRDLPLTRPIYPATPTLFALAKKAGYTTAMVAGKSKFETLDVPGTIDYAAVSEHGTSKDADVTEPAVRLIREYRPQVMFVHYPGADNAGHAKGWGSPEQVAAIESIDANLGQLFQALADAKIADKTLVILSADHGGAGLTHGPEDPRSRHIPWIVRGPGIRKGVDLTRYGDLDVRTEDTFAMSCYALGIPLPKGTDGKPVREALETHGEMLHNELATDKVDGHEQ